MEAGKTNEVYIGNGKTVQVPQSETIRTLDINKAIELYEANPDKEFLIGMGTDWFFTAQSIKSKDDITDFPLRASCWDVPTVEIDDERIPCYIEVEKTLFAEIRKQGYESGIAHFEFWLKDFFKRFSNIEYEPMKEFWVKVDELLKSYEETSSKKPDSLTP